jgi:hypothetical protein
VGRGGGGSSSYSEVNHDVPTQQRLLRSQLKSALDTLGVARRRDVTQTIRNIQERVQMSLSPPEHRSPLIEKALPAAIIRSPKTYMYDRYSKCLTPTSASPPSSSISPPQRSKESSPGRYFNDLPAYAAPDTEKDPHSLRGTYSLIERQSLRAVKENGEGGRLGVVEGGVPLSSLSLSLPAEAASVASEQIRGGGGGIRGGGASSTTSVCFHSGPYAAGGTDSKRVSAQGKLRIPASASWSRPRQGVGRHDGGAAACGRRGCYDVYVTKRRCGIEELTRWTEQKEEERERKREREVSLTIKK